MAQKTKKMKFNLSKKMLVEDEIVSEEAQKYYYEEEDIKEFIKELKEEIYEDDLLGWRNKKVLKHYSKKIDRLAGVRFK